MAQQKAIVGPGDIIVGAWLNFRTNVGVYAEFVVWFVLLRIIQWAMNTLVGAYIDDRYLRIAMDVLSALPIWFMYAVLTVALIDTVSRHLRDRKSDVKEALFAGFRRVLPAIWGGFLAGALVTLGFVALVIPGIVLFVWYRFVQDFVVVDDVRAVKALGDSRRLVARRWTDVFARITIPGVFFYVATLFVTYLANLLAGSVLGDPAVFFAQLSASQPLPNTYLLVAAALQAVINGFALPLFIGADLILWYDLKRTA